MKTSLLGCLEKHGGVARAVSIDHVQDLRQAIETGRNGGCLDETFYQERLSGFEFEPPASLAEARSLIVVAVRHPQTRFTFNCRGSQVLATVPPTYLHWEDVDRQVEQALAHALEGQGYRLVPALLPKKLLAVCSGLAAYGRNNITYVPGMGSYHRLVIFYSDLPCGSDFWQDPRMLERCETCRACLRHCPSGAITPDRFLLRAERCIVFHNEYPSDTPFPDWMESSWHNALVGCMYCQTVCPENEDHLLWVEDGAEFSSEETELLLAGTPPDEMPPSLLTKLVEHDLVGLLDVLPRNLGVLLDLA